MSVRRLSSCLLPLLLIFALVQTAAAVETVRTRDGYIFKQGNLSLLVTGRLGLVPSLRDGDSETTIATTGPADKPAFYLTTGGLDVADFRVDWGSLKSSPVDDDMGPGTEVTFSATARNTDRQLYTPIVLEARVSLTFHDRFPEMVVSRAVFINRGERQFHVDEVVAAHVRLDRRTVDPAASPWDLASYMGTTTRWGDDYALIRLTADFKRRNYMGFTEVSNRIFCGGGTPLVDIWAPEAGVAVASAEDLPQLISLPVSTSDDDGTVDVAITQQLDPVLGQDNLLEPGDSISTIDCAIIVHHRDFFDPLRSYSNMLRARGVDIPETSPPPTFEPYWKSWGLRFDFTLEQIYASLEELRKVGVMWANLDDGWFTWYGDWDVNPEPGKFPGGEDDMRAFVDSVHGAGFKTGLWWYPQGVSAESDLFKEHPEWLVKDRDGNYVIEGRGLYSLCPTYQPCIDFAVSQVKRFMQDWGYDGLYLDTRGMAATPPCFNPAHHHKTPLETYQHQNVFYKAIYDEAQRIKPQSPVEMCICAMPHDPFKMPYYNVASSSDPVNLLQVRRRIKVEKAYRGGSFAVGDCYQVPMDEWTGFSVPESFESAVGTGAQVTTFFTDLTAEQQQAWKRWVDIYRQKKLAWNEYLNLYDLAFDEPEGHAVRVGDKMYYGFFHSEWSAARPIELRGLDRARTYKVYEYGRDEDLGTVSGSDPVIRRGFRDNLLLELTPIE